ncbi:conserved hypothetical protein [Beggiatoa sp. PS]|nr:conserved hypothetical protein [Beggiatoa sp. PS]
MRTFLSGILKFIMFEHILYQMREKIRTREYIMTLHAEEEMDDDGLTIFDIERAILTGDIVERQKEPKTSEWKYRLKGYTLTQDEIIVVTKLSITGKLVIITVFRS